LTSAFWRYTAFQIPGWLLAAGGGVFLYRTMDVPAWVASGVLVVWVIKDYALYPLLRRAYELDLRRPIDRLVGERGTANDDLSPGGYIRVRGELWRARVDEGQDTITAGTRVEVAAIDGATLVVTPVPGSSPDTTRRSGGHPPRS
jgi:membrane protein implicated in regulation of membrane protease activity